MAVLTLPVRSNVFPVPKRASVVKGFRRISWILPLDAISPMSVCALLPRTSRSARMTGHTVYSAQYVKRKSQESWERVDADLCRTVALSSCVAEYLDPCTFFTLIASLLGRIQKGRKRKC